MRSMPGSLPGSQLSNVWDSSSVQSGVSFGCAPPLQRWVAEGPGLSVSCQRRGGGGSGTVTSPAEGLQSLHKPPFALGQRIQSDFTATAKAAGCSTRRCGSENLLVSQVNSLARLEWGGGTVVWGAVRISSQRGHGVQMNPYRYLIIKRDVINSYLQQS